MEVGGSPDPTFGWTVSLYDLESQVDAVRAELDHRYLNDIGGLEVPSLENLALWIWNKLANATPGLRAISVARGLPGQSEGCTYRGADSEVRSYA